MIDLAKLEEYRAEKFICHCPELQDTVEVLLKQNAELKIHTGGLCTCHEEHDKLEAVAKAVEIYFAQDCSKSTVGEMLRIDADMAEALAALREEGK